jgi:DNA-binding response OmpR family regulator
MPYSILIIEDDPVLLRGLSDNFRLRGYDVTTAADGALGLATALERSFDLLVLDVMLPKMHGYEVCQRIRRSGLNLPIIMLTAKGQEEDIVLGLEMGADDYVTKPFSVRELMARARAFLRRTATRESCPSRMAFGEFELDVEGRQLRRAGEPVTLTAREYQLLEYFLKRAGRALSRREILQQVWGRRIAVGSRCVDRCVTTLRAKIEPDTQQPRFIVTVREIGYRFESASLEDSPAEPTPVGSNHELRG